MAFQAFLHLGDNTIPPYKDPSNIKILELDYGFSQSVNNFSFIPNEKPKGGIISLVIEATGNEEFVEWMISPDLVKDGVILFHGKETEGAIRKLIFKNAHCIQFHEKFRSEGAAPMQTILTISCPELKIDNIEYVKDSAIEK